MAKSFSSSFSRRGPDIMTEELAVILSGTVAYEFKALFDLVYANLRARSAASGGEEMLRLRAYEKLQSLVYRGMVRKVNKKYQGLAALATALPVIPALPSLTDSVALPGNVYGQV